MSVTQAIPIYTRRNYTARYFIESLPNLHSNDTDLRMVAIPAGSFVMGAPEMEAESRDNERPQHEVNVSAFCMGKYPVTQAQWRSVASMPKIKQDIKEDPSNFKGNNLPVEQVSWFEAVEFCDRLSVHTGKKYRLPSEAEWEYACRAMPSPPIGNVPKFDGTFNYDGTIVASAIASAIVTRKGQIYPPFHFGETITPEIVSYDGSHPYGEAPKGEYRKTTTPVGQSPANAFGLYDMHGNILEWCEDDWHDNYEGAPSDGRAWVDNDNRSQNEGINKLLRGGSWVNDAWDCRSACRDHHGARFQDHISGFRVVCVFQ